MQGLEPAYLLLDIGEHPINLLSVAELLGKGVHVNALVNRVSAEITTDVACKQKSFVVRKDRHLSIISFLQSSRSVLERKDNS